MPIPEILFTHRGITVWAQSYSDGAANILQTFYAIKGERYGIEFVGILLPSTTYLITVIINAKLDETQQHNINEQHQKQAFAEIDPQKEIEKAVAAAKEYYKLPGNEAGGRLRAILDEGNVDDGIVQHCFYKCSKENDVLGTYLCRIFFTLSDRERHTVYCQVLGILDYDPEEED